MKILLASIAACVVMLAPTSAVAGDVFYPGEELVYRVSYLNITLGTIRTVSEGYTEVDGVKYPVIKVYINSHPNIPFVSLHAIFKSRMDNSLTYSHRFDATSQEDDGSWIFDTYVFDYKKRTLTIENFEKKKKVKSETTPIKKHYNDGSSLLFAARALLRSGKTYKLPTVVMEEKAGTIINFTGKTEDVDIDAVDYDVKTVYLKGDAQWTGTYGMSGNFEGWFSDDDAAIPILAKMSLYVGAATIELMSWKRGDWQPPRAD